MWNGLIKASVGRNGSPSGAPVRAPAAALALLAFVVLQTAPAFAETGEPQASTAAEHAGPTEPIGPSSRTPEAKRRIDSLLQSRDQAQSRHSRRLSGPAARRARNAAAAAQNRSRTLLAAAGEGGGLARGSGEFESDSMTGATATGATASPETAGAPTSGQANSKTKPNALPPASVVANGQGALPALVGGSYGFSAPTPFEGTPKSFVSLGQAAPAYGIVVEKLHHRLSLFRLREDGRYEVVKTYRAITGKDPEDKKTSGDLRTPEGIYFVTGKIEDRNLPAKYGRAAFTLDYPNIFDLRQRKSGYGIWIHATDDPRRLQNPFDTEGCVVVSNEDLIDLERYIKPFFEVPIVITKEMSHVAEDALVTPRTKATEMIEGWRQAWESSAFDSYMGHYSKNFRSLGKSRDGWQKYKETLSDARDGDIKVSISEPKILAFEDQLLVVFLQEYQSKSHRDFGRKFLYLQWEGDRYRIIAEKWYREKKTSTAERTPRPLTKTM